MRTYNSASISAAGIGPEVIEAGQVVLEAAEMIMAAVECVCEAGIMSPDAGAGPRQGSLRNRLRT